MAARFARPRPLRFRNTSFPHSLSLLKFEISKNKFQNFIFFQAYLSKTYPASWFVSKLGRDFGNEPVALVWVLQQGEWADLRLSSLMETLSNVFLENIGPRGCSTTCLRTKFEVRTFAIGVFATWNDRGYPPACTSWQACWDRTPAAVCDRAAPSSTWKNNLFCVSSFCTFVENYTVSHHVYHNGGFPKLFLTMFIIMVVSQNSSRNEFIIMADYQNGGCKFFGAFGPVYHNVGLSFSWEMTVLV